MTTTPKTIDEYLEQLQAALKGADRAMAQDALYDAEEYLRSELAEHPEWDEATMLANVASSYGAPEEVAEIYRDKETQVENALRPPAAAQRRSALGRFFSVFADPIAYSSLFYMLLSLATGIFYFTWVVTGLSLSLGLSILIFGLPFAVLFISTVRALSLVEGRLIESMLGVRMPRRPLYADRGKPFTARIKAMFIDPRTWSTLLYMLLKLPLGIVYFVFAVIGLTVPLALAVSPVTNAMFGIGVVNMDEVILAPPLWALPLTLAVGVVLLCLTLHVARGVGQMQGQLAKHFLVKTAQY
ncbi:MAG TPA: sensor domain-containing protein [Rudaea sp.]|nr:sensor domain-containing protein [Rudaea sp.]